MANTFGEVEALELHERLASEEPPFLLDVRQPHEWDIVNLEPEGAVMIPLAELPDRLDEIPADREIVVYCRTGARQRERCSDVGGRGFFQRIQLRGRDSRVGGRGRREPPEVLTHPV